MDGRGTFLRVGTLIVAALILLLGLVWFLGGLRFGKGAEFETYFGESVQGLEVGAPVKFRGVTLGRVTDIGLVSAEYGQDKPIDTAQKTSRLVFVRFIIDPKRVGHLPSTGMAVKTGLRARLASQGITGITYIELDFVDPSAFPPISVPWTPKAQYIPSMPSTLTQVQDAAQAFLAKLNKLDIDQLTRSLTELVGDLHTDLTTGDVHTTLTNASTLLTTLQTSVKQANLPGLTADLRKLAEDPKLRATIASSSEVTARLAAASKQLPALIATLQATLQRADEGTADIQAGLLPILRDMQAITGNLRDTTADLRRNPAGLLAAPPPPPSRQESTP